MGARAPMWLCLLCLGSALLAGASVPACPALPTGGFAAPPPAGCVELSPGFYAHWSVAPAANATSSGSITFTLDLLPNATAAGSSNASGAAPPPLARASWLGIGVSPSGSMKGADLAVFERAAGGAWTAQDMHATGFEAPLLDASQDIRLLSAVSAGGRTTIVFQRPLVTCDTEQDLPIRPGVPDMLIWAAGDSPRMGYHGTTRGGVSVLLHALPPCPADATDFSADCSMFPPGAAARQLSSDPSMKTLELAYSNQSIPVASTTYYCKYVKLPADKKYHITAYEGTYSPRLHHMVLFRCPASGPPVPATPAQLAGEPFDCTEQGPTCLEYVLVWAPGAGASQLPPQAGIPFGAGEDVYFVLNAHYDNPDGVPGLLDSSGFRIQYTDKLRPHDMGILTLGSWDITLPPGQAAVSTPPNVCPSACTQRFPGPLNVFQTFLHMHMTGSSMRTQHMRGSRELHELASIPGFDFDFNYPRASVPATRIIMPGDELTTVCNYNTLGRTNVTKMGLGSQDEMCFSYVSYWPRMPSNLSTCIASTGDRNVSDVSVAICGEEIQSNLANWTDPAAAVQKGLDEGWLVEMPNTTAPYTPYQQPECALPAPPAGQANGTAPIVVAQAGAAP